ncbi:MAG: DNA repair protein RadA [Phycisphaerales bacterium]|nr:DNA repair protein RadA [Phycisphaerales bacterium]
MAKQRIQFLCNHCGGVQAKWMGKCPDCGTWDSLEEYKTPTPDGRAVVRQPHTGDLTTGGEAVVVSDIDEQDIPRIPTGNGEFDRILGGGIVPGSVVLVGGEPGIGKSTLMLQVANALAARDEKKGKNPKPEAPILYVTSEESARQTKLRASRLGVASSTLLVLAETNLERIVNQINKIQPAVVVIDSIQMIYKPDLPAAPGSVTQLRDGCMELVYLAKASGIAMLLVGHVTKAGTLAGPKIVEHIVDTVIYFEGDRFHSHRIVRCVKNRFGSTHEVGLFEMTGQGLREVSDPGNLFVEQYGPGGPPSGSIITAAMQGTRVLLVEVQALTASSVIGAAKRKTSGVSADRVAMIIAVLEKRADLRLAADDVFINIIGGVRIIEPAIDLAIALAIASAHSNRPMAAGTLAIGELGLGGEIRPVPQLEQRLREASRLGLGHGIVPHMGGNIPKLGGMALHPVRRLSQALADI